jgi:hypothetical protein
MNLIKLFKSLSKTRVLLGLVATMSPQLIFAQQLKCNGGTGDDAVFASLDTENNLAWITKKSTDLPKYLMSCKNAEGVILRCEEAGGRVLLLDSLGQARYFGSRLTTPLTCVEACDSKDRLGKCGGSKPGN